MRDLGVEREERLVLRNPKETYAGARLRIRVWNGFHMEGERANSAQVIADEDGQFDWRMPRLDETVRIHVRCGVPGRELESERDLLLVAGDPDPGALTLNCYVFDSEVAGRVVAKGSSPVAGALVSPFKQSTKTAEDGSYRLRGTSVFSSLSATVYAAGFALAEQVVRLNPGGVATANFEGRERYVCGRVPA